MKHLGIVPVTLLAALGLLVSSMPAAGQDAPAADKNAPAADKTAPVPDADKTAPAADKDASAADQDVPPVATNLTPEDQKKLDKDAAAKAKKEAADQAAADKKKAKNSKNDPDAIGSRDLDKGAVEFYSLEKEIALGKQLAQEVERQAKIVDDPIIAEYVNRVGQNLVRNSDAKVPFTIKVVDSEEINAFALPGGFFFVNTGILLNADNEAEMAGVMAHEIAHVAARHGTRQASRGELMQIMTIPLWMMGGWTGYAIRQGMSLAIPLGFLQFSQGFEKEADYLGLQYMYKAGYDPTAFVDFFEKIQTLEKKKPGTMSKVFSSHPPTDTRIKVAQDEIQKILVAKPEYVLNTSEFNDVKARVEMLHNRRKVSTPTDPTRPQLRRATGSSTGTDTNPDATTTPSDSDDRPTLKRRDN
jgi:predicted Zn-dependent protease